LRDTVVVFARAPRLGAVKRRLARELGARAALRFHQQTLRRMLRKLRVARRFRVLLAVTPDRATARWPLHIARMPQGRGDLGRRMHRACRRFRTGRVVLVGSDIPDLSGADIAAAFSALGRADAVFGPAADGGYWLVGLSPRRPARPFGAVRWSSEHALADTLANFRGRRVARLRTLRDVDTAADYRAVVKAGRDRRSRLSEDDRRRGRGYAAPQHSAAISTI
jgi:rSAM/selenodomain-associated transferase 1